METTAPFLGADLHSSHISLPTVNTNGKQRKTFIGCRLPELSTFLTGSAEMQITVVLVNKFPAIFHSISRFLNQCLESV